MQIREERENKRRHLALLLLADESMEMVEKYLDRGVMYVLEEEGQVKAECVVTDEGGGVLEIKNLAVAPDCQRQGLGRRFIEFLALEYASTHEAILVGTGDSPLTVPFYERCGFVRSHVVKDFFIDNYDHPIIEAGVELRDMVYLRRALRSG